MHDCTHYEEIIESKEKNARQDEKISSLRDKIEELNDTVKELNHDLRNGLIGKKVTEVLEQKMGKWLFGLVGTLITAVASEAVLLFFTLKR